MNFQTIALIALAAVLAAASIYWIYKLSAKPLARSIESLIAEQFCAAEVDLLEQEAKLEQAQADTVFYTEAIKIATSRVNRLKNHERRQRNE